MAQGYCTVISTPGPFALKCADLTKATVCVAAPASIVWSDGATDSYDPAASGIKTVYDPYPKDVDATLFVWLVLAVKGAPHPVLAKESDQATFNALTGGTWAPLYRIVGPSIYPVAQI